MVSQLRTHLPQARPIPVREALSRSEFERDVLPAYMPVVLRNQVSDWPVVGAGRDSDEAVAGWLRTHANGQPIETFTGAPGIGGRFFYDDTLTGTNFERGQASLGVILDRLIGYRDEPQAPSLYAGAAVADGCVPDFAKAHVLPLLDPRAMARLWIGNAVTVSTHYDLSDNIACVAAGHRRFTLFPPEQVRNLYVGPLDFTLAGQPVSLVSVKDPDLERFPRFAEAMSHAVTADLGPGDAIYIPPLWWHQVEALSPFNLLVNYWWNAAGAPPSPFEAMIHSVMTVRPLPPAHRDAWRAMFEHYVFEADGDPAAHIPDRSQGVLGRMTPTLARRIRDFLAAGLRRG